MADYRSWCASCGREVNFGSHEPDCDYLHAQRIAYQEQREWEKNFWDSYKDKTNEEVYQELADEIRRNRSMADAMHASGKKIDALKDVLMDKGSLSDVMDKLRAEGLRLL
jgi:hypothetical protein